MRVRNVSALLLVVGIMLSACSGTTTTSPTTGGAAASAQPKTGGTLRIGTSADVLTMDLPSYRGVQDLLIGSLIFDALAYQDKDGKLQPGLATSWKQTDPVTYVFTLRQGVKFQDGTPFNATAVKRYFERAIKGVKSARFYEMTKTITADTDSQVTFVLKNAFTPFLANVAFTTGFLQSPSSMDKSDEEISRNPVGTGPYKLTEWVAADHMTLVRNDLYWGPKPKLDKIIVRFIADDNTRMAALEAGEVDVIQNAPPHRAADLKKSSTLQLLTRPYAQSFWLAMTASYGPLKDKRVRQAIAMAVDRKSLVQNVTEGINREATGFIPPELMDSKTKPVVGDTAAAKKLLADAGYPTGFKIELWSPSGQYLKDNDQSAALQPMLKAIGVDVQIKNMTYAAYSDALRRHEGQLFVLGWAHTSSPDGFYRGVFLSTSTSNWSDYKNPAVDVLLNKAVAEPTLEAAVKDWQEVDQLLVDDAAGAPISFSSLIYASSKKVHDFFPTAFGIFDGIAGAWIE